MTDKQPEALSIAKRLKDQQQPLSLALRHKAAAELRRLHEENETLRAKLSEPEPEPVAVAIKSHEFIDTPAKWGENFVEVINPLEENSIMRFYFESPQQPEPKPVAFKIYKRTPPKLGIPDVKIDALPWVYDQDPSSGYVASMWVVPA